MKSLAVIALVAFIAWQILDFESDAFWPAVGAPLMLGACAFAFAVWLVALGVRHRVGGSSLGGTGLGADDWDGGGDGGGGGGE